MNSGTFGGGEPCSPAPGGTKVTSLRLIRGQIIDGNEPYPEDGGNHAHDDLAKYDLCPLEEVYRLMSEDEHLHPIDDYVVYYSEAEAVAACATVVADPRATQIGLRRVMTD